MLRLLNKQGFKVLRNSCRHSVQIRHVYTDQAPFCGPATYATLARRFSSNPNPLDYFTKKKEKEAIERGQYVDIHDAEIVAPEDFDILITDMNDKRLRSEVSELVGIPYLQKATKDEANIKVSLGHGFLHGIHFRIMFPCVVIIKDKAHWIFFIVDSGAPLTYLSAQASEVLGIRRGPVTATIAGYNHPVHTSPPTSHFADINILGNDFITAYNVALGPNRDEGTVQLFFDWGSKWEISPKL